MQATRCVSAQGVYVCSTGLSTILNKKDILLTEIIWSGSYLCIRLTDTDQPIVDVCDPHMMVYMYIYTPYMVNGLLH